MVLFTLNKHQTPHQLSTCIRPHRLYSLLYLPHHTYLSRLHHRIRIGGYNRMCRHCPMLDIHHSGSHCVASTILCWCSSIDRWYRCPTPHCSKYRRWKPGYGSRCRVRLHPGIRILKWTKEMTRGMQHSIDYDEINASENLKLHSTTRITHRVLDWEGNFPWSRCNTWGSQTWEQRGDDVGWSK